MFIAKYINKNLDRVLTNDVDPLNKVRANFLVNALGASVLVMLLALPGFYINSFHFLLYRSIGMIFILTSLIWVLLKTPKWKLVAHLVCAVVALVIYSNSFVYIEGVKIITLQFMLLLIVMSYYLLGNKWGIFYSAISFVFMSIYFSVFGQEPLMSSEAAKDYTFLTVLVFNFLLIIYLQYHFFNAFNSTIKQLKVKQKEEALMNEKLKEAIIAADQLAKAKSNFLSTISHELRTPLNGVIGMSNVLMLDDPREDQKESINVLKFSANNLMKLVNDVLDINKIESGKLELEKAPFKIRDLAYNIYRTFKVLADHKSINFSLNINDDLAEVIVLGDQTRLTQILSNLLDNALKFTKKGDVIFAINTIKKTENEIELQFCVSDTGIGIPKEKQEIVFDSFTQASTSTTRNYGGTGLGLTIVKNLLELHESPISIQSTLNVGTSFTFQISFNLFDLDEDTSLDKPNMVNEEMNLSNLKILIAEDNQMNILLMRKLLSKWNINPDFAENGSEALASFEINDYDLILMDIHMPIMDGYETTKMIRSHTDHAKANIPIIALTASVAMDLRHKITEIGINDFISKPFNPSELRKKLEAIAAKKLSV
jgi:signal transduction histidine kinase/ActR/RegA family two-component response regulator